MPKEPERLEIDIQKIFLTPPTSMREKITLFLMMLVIFIMCFGPTIFTDISPVRAIIVSAIPAFTVSWGWMVLLRSLFSFPKIPAVKRNPKQPKGLSYEIIRQGYLYILCEFVEHSFETIGSKQRRLSNKMYKYPLS